MFRLLLLLKIAKFQGKQKISKFRVRFLHGGKKNKKTFSIQSSASFLSPFSLEKRLAVFILPSSKIEKTQQKRNFFFQRHGAILSCAVVCVFVLIF